MPLMVIGSILEQAESMLNDFPSKTGIATTMSTRNIIKGRPNLDYSTMCLNMGVYVQLFEGTKNTQLSRSVGAVALNPSNEKGGYYLMYLRNWMKLHGFIWTELTTPEEVITRTEDQGKEDKKLLIKKGPIFVWSPGNIILDKQE